MFELACPWILLALILPFLFWFLLPQATTHLQAALKLPFYHELVARLQQTKLSYSLIQSFGFFFLIWSLAIFAAAGPRWIGSPIPLEREGRNILLALDLSGSMELDDMQLNGRPVSRLTVVRLAAEQFVKARPTDRIGLILFGTRAYLQTPLTYDHHNLLMRLEDATVGLAGQTTSIGDAIGLAVKHLEQVPAKGRVIILLTDGANNSGVLPPLKAAELAKQDKIKIYTIGLGAEPEQNTLGAVFFNGNTNSDLDEESLKKIAALTGGRYFRATDTHSLHEIYQKINDLEPIKQESAPIRPQQELYPWPLALALFLLFFWLFKRLGIQFLPNKQKVT